MSGKERQSRHREAIRYIENASEILRTKARKKDKYYEDDKYTRMACATAYNGVLLAANTYIAMKGKPIEKKKGARVNVDDYRKRLTSLNKKVLNAFNTAYGLLHIDGYYEGMTSYDAIRVGMNAAMDLINEIKPVGEPDMTLEQIPT